MPKAENITIASEPPHAAPAAQTVNEPARVAATQQSASGEATEPSRAKGCAKYRDLIAQYAWDVRTALAICEAESGGRPDAYNPMNSDGSNDAGLFQVNSIHVGRLIGSQERYDPAANVAAAYAIYRGSGWKAWATYTNGSYKKYL